MSTTNLQDIKVFGLPGCSSCLRLKEFVEQTGLSFESVNIEQQPQYREMLRRRGIHPPAVFVGDEGVPGHNLEEVSEFLGVPYEGNPRLSPTELKIRYDIFIRAMSRYIEQLTPELAQFCLPNRTRTTLECASHGTAVARAFLSAYYTDNYDMSLYAQDGEIQTIDELRALAQDVRERVNAWWEADGYDDPFDRVVKTYAGHHTLHEAWEREVWHTGQHARQVGYALELNGVDPDGRITEDDIRDLPMPKRLYE